ncbi:nuclear pore protein-like protein [Colletotrichum plurivorum]|uniref:Nuclear pore protein-like protein n=1 Tax=Colletotrichum plurivorum TaxID=2175906 RepID=A0A8H6JCX9_9PEZI|nr:nuclear pore protein-like protein [Colletotrichum plurivorum]
MEGFTELVLRPAAAPVGYEYDDTDMDSEWVRTPSEDTFTGDDEIEIDPYGDLLLHVGRDPESGEGTAYRVCSNALRRASPFWRRTIAETAAEMGAADEEDWDWTPSLYACQRGKSDGLVVLLNIIHSRFGMVPKRPTLPEVYSVLCLASMYEMEDVLHPWLGQWYEVIEEAESSRDGRDMARLVCIAWGLGDERLFVDTVVKIALTCILNDEGHIVTEDGVCLDEYLYDSLGSPAISGEKRSIPMFVMRPFNTDNVPEKIRSLRNQMAEDLPSHINRLIARLIDGKWMCQGISNIPITKNKKCDYVVLGSLFAGMIYVRGSQATELRIRTEESVADMLVSIKRVLSCVSCYEKHPDCNPADRLAEAMRRTIEETDTSLTTAAKESMRERRRRIGIDAFTSREDDG